MTSTVHLQRGGSSRCGSPARVLTTENAAVTCGLCLRLIRHEARTAEWMAEAIDKREGRPNGVIVSDDVGQIGSYRDLANSVTRLEFERDEARKEVQSLRLQIDELTRDNLNLRGEIDRLQGGDDAYWRGLNERLGTIR